MEARTPAIVAVNKRERKKKHIIVDIAVPADSMTSGKEKEKMEKYQDLKTEIKRICNMRSVITVPVIVGAIKKKINEWIGRLDISLN